MIPGAAARSFRASTTRIPVSIGGDVSEIQSHPLITSAVAVGDATAIQPVVSTLVFGFAFENLLIGAGRFHRVTQIFLELTVSLSLYTTAYSVLEFYYVKMLANADIYYQYRHIQLNKTPEDSEGSTLAESTDAVILRFHNMRLWARNALWVSIILLLCAGCSEIFAKSRLGTGAYIQFGILVLGALAVPYSVVQFRSEYRPLLMAYREDQSSKPRKKNRKTSELVELEAALGLGVADDEQLAVP